MGEGRWPTQGVLSSERGDTEPRVMLYNQQDISGRLTMPDSNAPIQSAIEQKLADGFHASHLAVENESHMHSVPPNSETHFKVTLVSDDFAGKNRVKRHQAIYSTLGSELQGGVHALALHLYTPEEWEARHEVSPASPQCLGGSKHDKV